MTTLAPENGCASSEDLNTRKSIKPAENAETEPLKIKLRICKKDVTDDKSGKSSRDSSASRSEVNNGEEKMGENSGEEKLPKGSSAGDPKMKLRSKKEESEIDSKKDAEEGSDKKRRRKDSLLDREGEKPERKRMKPLRLVEDIGEKSDELSRRRSKRSEVEATPLEKLKEDDSPKAFCWTCHKDGSVVKCDTCPRVFHLKCVSLTKDPSKDWICPECSLVLHAEKISTRSEAMKSLSLDQLCTLLNFAIGRMKNVPESQAFWKPVDPKEVPFYDKYITNPMDLNLLEQNMKAKMYGSPQAFLADAKWLLHNSIIFNTTQSPLTSTARFLVKICRQEMAEIENCPDCYLNAHTKEKWFIEVCRKPHILIWARLKGFPFWPAKAMSTNLKTQQVDARFFGAHDKAWVPVKECYLYSKNSPQTFTKKRGELDDAFLEAEGYIRNIRQKYGTFCFAPDKSPFMPEMYDKQLQSMIPNYKEEKPGKKKKKAEEVVVGNEGTEKQLHNGKRTSETTGILNCLKLKRSTAEESPRGEDSSVVSDFDSGQKVQDEILISSEVANSPDIMETPVERDGEDENDETRNSGEVSLRTPEHGYNKIADNSEIVQSSLSTVPDEEVCVETVENENIEIVENIIVEESKNECLAESSDGTKLIEEDSAEKNCTLKANNDQCEVSSTSADLRVIESVDREVVIEQEPELTPEDGGSKTHPTSSQNSEIAVKENSNSESAKKEDDKSPKSFVNLSCDQKQKILTEAKLLANIDEMTALEKQKVLNKLGLDASQVDIHQLAQENRQILETLTKKNQNEKQNIEEVSIKDEVFEQYLIEEESEKASFEKEPSPTQFGTIKVRDFNKLSNNENSLTESDKTCTEPMLKISDMKCLRDLLETKEPKKRKSLEDLASSMKFKYEPVIKLIKLDICDNNVEKLNKKLGLSNEVSLLMVDGEKKVDGESANPSTAKSPKKCMKKVRARKSVPFRTKPLVDPPKTVNVISVNTENSTAQKNLLKSLCLEEKKPEDSSRRTVLITTSEKGIHNLDLKSASDVNSKKQMQEVTIEAVKETHTGSEVGNKDKVLTGPKNLTMVADSHLIVTNNGPAIVSNRCTQVNTNLALAQNNLGQLSLVQLSSVPNGMPTNFINITSEALGFKNSVGTVYATPGFSTEFATSSSPVILSANLNSPVVLPTGSSPKGAKPGSEGIKISNVQSISRVVAGKPASGISVKSPASLGLVPIQPSVVPPVVTIEEDGAPLAGDVGAATTQLNSHSIKLAEHMRGVIEDLLKEYQSQGSLEAKCKLLQLELEKIEWKHQQEVMELKQHSERSMMELRSSLEAEKQKCLGELKTQLECQHQKMISEIKRKQWCANCGKEALFYCCWNTSYCDYPCQQQHWPGHMSTCAQLGNNTLGNPTGSQLQSKTPGMIRQNSNYVPVISRGGGTTGSSGRGGSHSGGPFSANRGVSNPQAQPAQGRRVSDASTPQLPINITIRPQHYFM